MPADTFTGTPGTHLSKNHNPALTAALDTLAGERSDMHESVAGGDFLGLVGTWTRGLGTSGVPKLSKAAAAEVGHAFATVRQPTREKEDRGVRPVAATLRYRIATADANDIKLLVVLYDTTTAAGTAPSRTVLAGDVDDDYDASSNTAAERKSQGDAKTIVVTVPEDDAVYLGPGRTLALEVLADAALTTVVEILAADVAFARTDGDLT